MHLWISNERISDRPSPTTQRSRRARGATVAARGLRTTARLDAKILASDPIEAVCAEAFAARGHELVWCVPAAVPLARNDGHASQDRGKPKRGSHARMRG